MNIEEIITLLNDIEKDYPVSTWRSQQFPIWPILRIGLFIELGDMYVWSGFKKSKHSKIKIASDVLSSLVAPSLYKKLSDKSKKVVLISNVLQSDKNGLLHDRLLDTLCDSMEREDIPYDFWSTYHPKVDSKRFRKVKNIWFQVRVISRLTGLLQTDEAVMDKYQEVSSYWNAKTEIPFPTVRAINRKMNVFKQMEAYWYSILQSTNASSLVYVCYYSDVLMAATCAAQRLGIISVDIQHGVINDYHAAYGSWKNTPTDGYPSLPSIFACWDKYSADVIHKWATKVTGHQTIVTGNFNFVQAFNNQKEKLERFSLLVASKDSTMNITVTLSQGFGLSSLIEQTMSQSPEEWCWWIRFHPSTKEEEKIEVMNKLQNSTANYEIEHSSNYPLAIVLAATDAHLTMFSSSVIEADLLHKPTIFCNALSETYYHEYVSSGKAQVLLSPEAIIKELERISRRDKSFSVDRLESNEKELIELLRESVNKEK